MERKMNMEEKNGKNAKRFKLIYNPSSAAPGFITKNVLSLPECFNFKFDDENCKRYL